MCVCVEGVLIFFLLSSFYLLFCAPVSHYHLLYSFFVITSSLVLSVLRLATPPLSISRPSRHHLLVSPVTILLPSSRSSITILLSSPSSIYHHYPPPVTCRCFNSINFIQILVLVYILFFVRLFFCFLDWVALLFLSFSFFTGLLFVCVQLFLYELALCSLLHC